MSICAIIVTYHPSSGSKRNIELISEMVDEVIIYDNTPDMTEVVASLNSPNSIQIFHKGRNDGLGIALNFGLHYAIENRFDWLATFDQDSQPTKGMLDKMLEDFSKYPNPDRVRILAPRHLDPSQVSNHPVVPNQDLGFQEMETVIM